jgi:four helix bundle protein
MLVHKCGIAQKEATESRYWLRLLAEADIIRRGQLQSLIQETNEIYAVITAIIVNAKKRL